MLSGFLQEERHVLDGKGHHPFVWEPVSALESVWVWVSLLVLGWESPQELLQGEMIAQVVARVIAGDPREPL